MVRPHLAAIAIMAAPNCTAEPREKWMSEDAMKAKIATLGYERIKTFKVSGSCYEIYGYTNDGRKAEVYFNPVTGDRVKSYIGG
ncbi:MAG TPA: PepSY domain-containing protein [Roseiarcus sp.]|nr:PepSY domain-containing protein [Roseiarcus sp.]